MLVFKLAWRNLWRKKKRTLITISAVFFAVLFSIFIDSLQKGSWNHMINNVVNYYYGHAQLQSSGYAENPSIDEAFQFSESYEKLLSSHENITHYIPRLESFALAASGEKSRGVMIIGTHPDIENRVTGLEERLVAGSYLSVEDHGVLLSEGVGETMHLSTGDTLILISQGYHGVNAAGKFPVTGIVELGPPELNNRMVYMSLPDAQHFFGADSLVTSVSMILKRRNQWSETLAELRPSFPSGKFVLKNWMELMPDLVQAKELDRVSGYVVYFILYTVISFGIFATILMMIKEREYEIGVMIAVGMSRLKLSTSIWFEILMTGLIGVLAGSIISLPVITYFHVHPLYLEGLKEVYEKFGFEPYLPTAVDIQIFITQAVIVFVISILISIYPISRIMKIDTIQSLKG